MGCWASVIVQVKPVSPFAKVRVFLVVPQGSTNVTVNELSAFVMFVIFTVSTGALSPLREVPVE